LNADVDVNFTEQFYCKSYVRTHVLVYNFFYRKL